MIVNQEEFEKNPLKTRELCTNKWEAMPTFDLHNKVTVNQPPTSRSYKLQ